jgi:hypothetical protein
VRFIDGLDLAAASFSRVEPKVTGCPGYAPADPGQHDHPFRQHPPRPHGVHRRAPKSAKFPTPDDHGRSARLDRLSGPFRFLSDEHISGAKAAFARFEQYRPRLPRIVEDQGVGSPVTPFL